MRRGHAHAGEDGARVHLDDADAIAHRLHVAVAQDVRHGQAVVEEAQVKLAMLQRAGHALVVLDAEEVCRRARMTPGAHVVRAVLRLQKAD